MNTITHGLLYDFSDPGSYIGAGFNWSSGAWATKFMIANEQYRTIANNQTDSNSQSRSNNTPTVTGRVDYTLTSNWDIGGSANIGRQGLSVHQTNSQNDGTFGFQGAAAILTAITILLKLMRLTPVPILSITPRLITASRRMRPGMVAMPFGMVSP